MDKAWFDDVRMSALGWASSVETTYDVCRTALERGIPGDFVECGVFAGAQAAVMARAITDHLGYTPTDYFKHVHLFDSFEGIPLAGPEDHEFLEVNQPAGVSACSMKEVQGNMERWGTPSWMLVYHPGLFDTTVPEFAESVRLIGKGKIAVLRLDGDLYRSTKVCVDHLYPLVAPGGYVIVDDFNLSGCRQAVVETINPAPITFRKPKGIIYLTPARELCTIEA